jgi:PEP-CTERM motif
MKNGIKYLVAGLVATGITVGAYANITVNAGTTLNTFLTDNTGPANYLSGDLVEVGMFSTAPTPGSSSLANFVVYGSTLTGTGLGAGIFSFTKFASDVGFAHSNIWIVVFNNATGINASQEGIYAESMASKPNWKFPATADVPNSTSVDLQDMFTDGTSGTLATGAQIIFGSVGVDPGGGIPNNIVKLALVPEPSTWMLVGTGLLGLLGLRRRRS